MFLGLRQAQEKLPSWAVQLIVYKQKQSISPFYLTSMLSKHQICLHCTGCMVSTLMPPAFAKHLRCFQLLKSCCLQVNRPCRMKAEHTSLMAAQAALRLHQDVFLCMH